MTPSLEKLIGKFSSLPGIGRKSAVRLAYHVLSMPEEEARCIAGWYYEDDLPMLVSQGLGCKTAKLRLGTRSEVWHITLRRPQARTLPKL